MMDEKRIKELVEILNKASRAYYQEAKEIMPNIEYDRLYDELVELEEKTGIILSKSPTQKVGYDIVSELPKERHPSRMLSLDKTKEVAALADFLGNNEGYLSWKLDGLTIVLTYNNGVLSKAVTRGNGEVGEVVTGNAKVFENVPLSIPYKGELVIRGEAVISYSDFEKINEEIEDDDAKYKNPRNLCSGSVRQLNSEITAKRNVRFVAFSFVSASGDESNIPDTDSKNDRMQWLKRLGFEIVESIKVTSDSLETAVGEFAEKIKNNDYPSDGLVLTIDSISISRSLGATAKFPRDAMAFKWKDEQAKTVLKEIEWNASRTGLINPVAVFEPVELEGTIVARASVHNLSIVEELGLTPGDEILVYKANMIIPQISENLTHTGNITYPDKCPVCGQTTEVKNDNGVKTLHCPNKDCMAKKIKSLTLFVSRDAMNIEGLSESTLEKFVSMGFIHEYADLFELDAHKEAITCMEGFGEKSYNKLIASIEKSKNVGMPNFLYSIGIPNVGLATAKLICDYFDYDFEKVMKATADELIGIEGLGQVIAGGFVSFFENENNSKNVYDLLEKVTLTGAKKEGNMVFDKQIFVVTGSVNHFKNRNTVRDMIESLGGKVASAVSSNTNYLINNDVNSSSSKNKKAKELGIPIITEEELIEMAGGSESIEAFINE